MFKFNQDTGSVSLVPWMHIQLRGFYHFNPEFTACVRVAADKVGHP